MTDFRPFINPHYRETYDQWQARRVRVQETLYRISDVVDGCQSAECRFLAQYHARGTGTEECICYFRLMRLTSAISDDASVLAYAPRMKPPIGEA